MNKKNDRVPTSQMNLVLRIAMGGMLIYIAYSLRGSFDQILFILFAALFSIVGAGIIVDSLRRIFKGDFDYLDAEGNIIEPDDLDELMQLDEELESLKGDVEQLEQKEDK